VTSVAVVGRCTHRLNPNNLHPVGLHAYQPITVCQLCKRLLRCSECQHGAIDIVPNWSGWKPDIPSGSRPRAHVHANRVWAAFLPCTLQQEVATASSPWLVAPPSCIAAAPRCTDFPVQAVNHPYLVVHSASSAAREAEAAAAASPSAAGQPGVANAGQGSAICAVCHDPFEVPEYLMLVASLATSTSCQAL
jgi:hypothetical protein